MPSTNSRLFLLLLSLLLLGATTRCVFADDPVCSADGTCNDDNNNKGNKGRIVDGATKGEVDEDNDEEEYDDEEEGYDEEDEDEDYPPRDLRGCEDTHTHCTYWASLGECEKNPRYMLNECAFSCGQCPVDVYMGEKQVEQGDDQDGENQNENIKRIMEEARTYMKEVVASDNKLRKTLHLCYNKHDLCAFWAALGECEANPVWMKSECGPVCKSCDQSLIETRCPILTDGSMPNAWEPGDLNQFFTNLTTLPEYKQYEPVILSKPKADDEDPKPWVVTLEKFMTEEECDHLIDLGYKEGYERSADVGEMRPDGTYGDNVNDGRTSENAWCQSRCYRDKMAIRVMDRIANVTGIPEPNSEYLQILKYEVGQFYQTHHDFIDHQGDRQPGPRMLTVFLYLNDVEEGGGTNFPDLDLTVEPKKGRALVWPSVLDKDPNKKEEWTEHQALPVIKGQKFGANAWLHLRDFKTPNQNNCH